MVPSIHCFSKRSLIASAWPLLPLMILCVAIGCARMSPLKPRAIASTNYYQSAKLIDQQEQLQRGQPRPIIDGIGWVVGIPSKLLLWNRRIDNHAINDSTEAQLSAYLHQNQLTTTRVRLNQYHPLDDWRRLIRNDRVGFGWRYTLGAISVLGETVLPGRIIGGDHYNPYTDTIHLYSDVPAVALHEAAHAKDFARRNWKGTYAFAYLLPIAPLYHESIATNDVLAYLQQHGTLEDQAAARRILYPAYATYVGSAAGTLLPVASSPLYYGSVVAGHAVGRYSANQVLNRPGNGPIPTPECTLLDSTQPQSHPSAIIPVSRPNPQAN